MAAVDGAPGARALVAVGLVASVAAPLTLTSAQFLALFALGAFLGAFAVMLARSATGVHDVASPDGLLDALHKAAVGAVLAVALGVLTVGLGASGWAVALGTMAALPFLRGLLDGRAPRHHDATLRTPPLAHCGTSELVTAWSASQELLEAASSPLMRARIAALRQEYLDELERRDHAGLRRWLSSVDPASSDPRLFLSDRDDGGTRHDLR